MIKNQETKCVEIIDENLPLGILANTAAILGITIGKQMPYVKAICLFNCLL